MSAEKDLPVPLLKQAALPHPSSSPWISDLCASVWENDGTQNYTQAESTSRGSNRAAFAFKGGNCNNAWSDCSSMESYPASWKSPGWDSTRSGPFTVNPGGCGSGGGGGDNVGVPATTKFSADGGNGRIPSARNMANPDRFSPDGQDPRSLVRSFPEVFPSPDILDASVGGYDEFLDDGEGLSHGPVYSPHRGKTFMRYSGSGSRSFNNMGDGMSAQKRAYGNKRNSSYSPSYCADGDISNSPYRTSPARSVADANGATQYNPQGSSPGNCPRGFSSDFQVQNRQNQYQQARRDWSQHPRNNRFNPEHYVNNMGFVNNMSSSPTDGRFGPSGDMLAMPRSGQNSFQGPSPSELSMSVSPDSLSLTNDDDDCYIEGGGYFPNTHAQSGIKYSDSSYSVRQGSRDFVTHDLHQPHHRQTFQSKGNSSHMYHDHQAQRHSSQPRLVSGAPSSLPHASPHQTSHSHDASRSIPGHSGHHNNLTNAKHRSIDHTRSDMAPTRAQSETFPDDFPETFKNSKPGKTTRGAQNLPPCRVCGNKASGLHFGVNTCEACNEFFRRSLKRGAAYYCSRNLSCQVWGKKRNPCSFCRYRRCLEVGMSRNAIKTGRYSHKTRAEYAREIAKTREQETQAQEFEEILRMLGTLVKSHDRYIRISSYIPDEDIYRQQRNFLVAYLESVKRRKRRKKKKSASNNDIDSTSSSGSGCVQQQDNISGEFQNVKTEPEEPKSEAPENNVADKTCNDSVRSDTAQTGSKPTDANAAAAGEGETVEIAAAALNLLYQPYDLLKSGETSTPKLGVNTGEVFKSTSKNSENSKNSEPGVDTDEQGDDAEGDDADENDDDGDSDSSDGISDCVGLTRMDADITERWLCGYISYAKLIPGFKRLPLCDQASLVRATWFEFWFIGAYRGFNSELRVVTYPIGHSLHWSQMTYIFGEEFTDISFHLADRMKTLKLSPEEMVLMKTVCLMAPDRCELEARDEVEQIYWSLVSALLHVLQKNRSGDTSIFPQMVGKMVELRTLSEVAMKAHSGALFQDTFPHKPLLGEMLEHVYKK